jgi:hypothetical protein
MKQCFNMAVLCFLHQKQNSLKILHSIFRRSTFCTRCPQYTFLTTSAHILPTDGSFVTVLCRIVGPLIDDVEECPKCIALFPSTTSNAIFQVIIVRNYKFLLISFVSVEKKYCLKITHLGSESKLVVSLQTKNCISDMYCNVTSFTK